MENGQWSWNYCNSDWWTHDCYDTKEEAIQDAKENYEVKGQDIEIGQIELVSLPTYIDTDDLFYNFNEQYGEELSEYDGDLFESVTKEQQHKLENELSKVLQKFYKKTKIKSNNYTIYNEHTVHID
jgi:hypothetical protein